MYFHIGGLKLKPRKYHLIRFQALKIDLIFISFLHTSTPLKKCSKWYKKSHQETIDGFRINYINYSFLLPVISIDP